MHFNRSALSSLPFFPSLLCSPPFFPSMSYVPHTILRPFGVKPFAGGGYLRRHARPCVRRASSVGATNGNELGGGNKRRRKRPAEESRLEVLYDDGFGSVTVKDYREAVRAMPRDDGGPPRWFCPVECGRPEVDRAPLLLFLSGIEGVGMELILHHKSLGKVFEVCCFHIPVNDRTPFEGLLQIVEEYVKHEDALSPSRPIYIIGDSFGGCLAISVAVCNPEIDLVLTLVNPASLQAVLPLLEAVAANLPFIHPHLLKYSMGNPLNMAMVSLENSLSPQETLQEFSNKLTSMLPLVSELGDIIQMGTLVWKLKLLKSGANYANSQLHMVQAEVLLLASGIENLPPSGEADRLVKSLKNCKVRYFRNRGDRLLMEDGFNLLTVIKGVKMYRRGRQWDCVNDFLSPTLSEFNRTFGEDFNSNSCRLFHQLLSPAMLSTTQNGKIVHGLDGVPDKGPVLFVGYHQLLAMEWAALIEGFLREKKTVIRTGAHQVFFAGNYETLRQELSLFDFVSMYGAVPVSPINTYKLFERNEFVLLYPGGVREALHRKGETYKLFWPDQTEFVRMAARFGVTVIPFGCVGEDDFLEIVVDYNDQKNIPYIRDEIKSFNRDFTRLRDTVKGEDGNQVLHLPVVLPKLPGRLYFLFGRPIEMEGMDNVLTDRKKANQVYFQIESEVENAMSYLKRKRNEDPYRSIARRVLYQATWGPSAQVPTFEP
ncbi:acyltransferase-like protein At1g54570, chloroplastic isoform X3 [Triticum aestivum]|uniref:acyltransferase-like protein At1g54570, chloroplastic isoform X3 n=1 Tax=Triticum aestivum TaxID=4565 RepID=UPI001D01D574|nr:acyltransferase-like protein At1g54570, chloroplastic isoform X3 [Triticum aestivum]